MNDELIWVLPAAEVRNAIHKGGNFQEITPGVYWTTPDDAQVDPHQLPYMGELSMARLAAEQDESFLQPIPYVVMTQGDRYVRYRRLPKTRPEEGGGETRLAGRTSIGAGGHLSAAAMECLPIRLKGGDTNDHADPQVIVKYRLIEEIWRELREEFVFLRVNSDHHLQLRGTRLDFRGYLLDRRNPVGRVHLGLIYTLALPDDVRVAINPDEAHKLRLEDPLDPIDGNVDPELEGWSELIVRHHLLS